MARSQGGGRTSGPPLRRRRRRVFQLLAPTSLRRLCALPSMRRPLSLPLSLPWFPFLAPRIARAAPPFAASSLGHSSATSTHQAITCGRARFERDDIKDPFTDDIKYTDYFAAKEIVVWKCVKAEMEHRLHIRPPQEVHTLQPAGWINLSMILIDSFRATFEEAQKKGRISGQSLSCMLLIFWSGWLLILHLWGSWLASNLKQLVPQGSSHFSFLSDVLKARSLLACATQHVIVSLKGLESNNEMMEKENNTLGPCMYCNLNASERAHASAAEHVKPFDKPATRTPMD